MPDLLTLPSVRHEPDARVDRGKGFRRVGPARVEVYDLDMAAWFLLQNLPVADVMTNGREFVITFHDPEEENRVATLSTGWLNSEASRFSAALRQLKKVTISRPNVRFRR